MYILINFTIKRYIPSVMHLSKATAITLLVVGVLALVTVIAFFTFKCVEWSPRRRYNRIDFLMNDVDE